MTAKICLFIGRSSCLIGSVSRRKLTRFRTKRNRGRAMDAAGCWVMVYGEERHLAIIAADASDGPARLREQLHSGRNFILIGSAKPDLMDAACAILRTSADRLPKPLSRNGLFMLGPHLEPRDFDAALEAIEHGRHVYFLEHF